MSSGAEGAPQKAPSSDEAATRAGAKLGGRDLALVVLARLALSAAVLLCGFRSVSDDDYARVVIAEELAFAPKLDPSGTSWLPFPFWITGGAMLLFGRSLLVARAVAILSGAASSVLVAIAAERITRDRASALFAAYFATLVGWSAWLGVATVPELLTASLTLFAAGALASSAPRDRALGGLALLCATLSRYEPWPVAAVFAIWNAADLVRRRRSSDELRSPKTVVLLSLASLLAISGPVLWMVWNHLAHGDALHFLARVAAYRRALDKSEHLFAFGRFVAYPIALLREMPEVVVVAILGLFVIAPSLRRRARSNEPSDMIAPAKLTARGARVLFGLAGAQLLALALAFVKDGAPTHHPERAVLFPALALVVFAASTSGAWRPWLIRPRTLGAAALLLAIRAAVMPAVARALGPDAPGIGPHLIRQTTPHEAFLDRSREVAMGRLIAKVVPPGSRIYFESVPDYGYFAIFASSGRPEDFLLSDTKDPRAPRKQGTGPEPGTSEYSQWLSDNHVEYVLAQGATKDALRSLWTHAPVAETGGFALFRPSADDPHGDAKDPHGR